MGDAPQMAMKNIGKMMKKTIVNMKKIGKRMKKTIVNMKKIGKRMMNCSDGTGYPLLRQNPLF